METLWPVPLLATRRRCCASFVRRLTSTIRADELELETFLKHICVQWRGGEIIYIRFSVAKTTLKTWLVSLKHPKLLKSTHRSIWRRAHAFEQRSSNKITRKNKSADVDIKIDHINLNNRYKRGNKGERGAWCRSFPSSGEVLTWFLCSLPGGISNN